MSVSNYDLLQAKVDAELARYTEELMVMARRKLRTTPMNS